MTKVELPSKADGETAPTARRLLSPSLVAPETLFVRMQRVDATQSLIVSELHEQQRHHPVGEVFLQGARLLTEVGEVSVEIHLSCISLGSPFVTDAAIPAHMK